jgi:hypothetical protein
VTTVKFRDDLLPGLSTHPNFTLIDLVLNNSDGRLPYVDKGTSRRVQYSTDVHDLYNVNTCLLLTTLRLRSKKVKNIV